MTSGLHVIHDLMSGATSTVTIQGDSTLPISLAPHGATLLAIKPAKGQ